MLAELDLVPASVHSKLRMNGDPMTARMVAAVSNPRVNVLGHCTGRLVGLARHPAAVRLRRPRAVFRATCAEHWHRGGDQQPPRTLRPTRTCWRSLEVRVVRDRLRPCEQLDMKAYDANEPNGSRVPGRAHRRRGGRRPAARWAGREQPWLHQVHDDERGLVGRPASGGPRSGCAGGVESDRRRPPAGRHKAPPIPGAAVEPRLAANTVARAYKELEAAGLDLTRGRLGTVVTSDAVDGLGADARTSRGRWLRPRGSCGWHPGRGCRGAGSGGAHPPP